MGIAFRELQHCSKCNSECRLFYDKIMRLMFCQTDYFVYLCSVI